MTEAPFVWKFDAVITLADGRRMPRVILVPQSDHLKAHAALMVDYPDAEVAQNCELATAEELHASGGAFIEGEATRVTSL